MACLGLGQEFRIWDRKWEAQRQTSITGEMYRDESSGPTDVTASCPLKLSTFALISCLSCKVLITNTWPPRYSGTLDEWRRMKGLFPYCAFICLPLSECLRSVCECGLFHSASPSTVLAPWQCCGHSPNSGQFMTLMSPSETFRKNVIQPFPAVCSAFSNPLILPHAPLQKALLLDLLGNLEVFQ